MEINNIPSKNKSNTNKLKLEVEDPLDDLINFFNQILEDYDIDELIRSKNNLKN
ncbi:hypothetical protein [Paracholeplasma manati]|uniref:hypothetical protein n=1 Tax=Paracholeplasma manati TaxID=591373 RepID=UPI002407E7DA|nr:hypothetical protein [Paracholeplasma manati]MDG0887896.1 hypothetical protein [Paracholeplasma manati]